MGERVVFRFVPFTTRQDPYVEPEYSATCVAGDETDCGEESGVHYTAVDVDDWMRKHMQKTGHQTFRRRFDDFALLEPAELPPGLEPARVRRVGK
ncbi:DUF7848 domain-containing protein [Streptomyces sp. NPDC002643]